MTNCDFCKKEIPKDGGFIVNLRDVDDIRCSCGQLWEGDQVMTSCSRKCFKKNCYWMLFGKGSDMYLMIEDECSGCGSAIDFDVDVFVTKS